MQILVIDPSATSYLSVKRALGQLLPDAEFQHSHGGVQAQDMVERQKPDLVVYDPSGKEGHSTDFIRWFRDHLRLMDTPILVHTDIEDVSQRLRLLAYQPISFVTKPGQVFDFREALEGLGLIPLVKTAE
jgi:DNA-binding NarL/FixJ family response regulator